MCVLPRKVSSCDHKMDVCYALGSMAIPVVQFSMEGYKFEKVFGYKFTVVKWTSWILRIGVMGQVSKSAKIWLSKSIFNVKNHPDISDFFSLKNLNLGSTFLLLTFFDSINF